MSGSKRREAKKVRKLHRILGIVGVGLGIVALIYVLNLAGCI